VVLDVCRSMGVVVGGCLVVKGWRQVADVVPSSNHRRRQPSREGEEERERILKL